MEQNFASRLKELRLKNGLTENQLARKLDLKKESILNYENGKQIPRLKIFLKFCDFFEVSADYLAGLE
ncbi:MAG: helix-turn-helix domain-containing protein [Firmicutes bacterium]|nr:helix-turn-helix domain-containing protein [Bacillota bacterium]